jgi:hypothetical protein
MGKGHATCKLCDRIRRICRQHKRDQERLNAGKSLKTIGQRIVDGEF